MRKILFITGFIGLAVLLMTSFSDHPMAADFVARVAFEFSYKILAVLLFYGLCRAVLDRRRHQIILNYGKNAGLYVYLVTIACIAFIVSFAG